MKQKSHSFRQMLSVHQVVEFVATATINCSRGPSIKKIGGLFTFEMYQRVVTDGKIRCIIDTIVLKSVL